MKLNQKNAVGANGRHARTLNYKDIVSYFWWDKSKKAWFPRDSKADAVGRVYSVLYLAGERFYKRVLLLHRKGFRSFKELHMVDSVKAKSYQVACNWLGLLVDDYLYNKALLEASVAQTGYQLAEMFAIMCFQSPPADAKQLFKTHFLAFTDDIAGLDVKDRNSRLLRDSEQ
jgi:hypothetical protein